VHGLTGILPFLPEDYPPLSSLYNSAREMILPPDSQSHSISYARHFSEGLVLSFPPSTPLERIACQLRPKAILPAVPNPPPSYEADFKRTSTVTIPDYLLAPVRDLPLDQKLLAPKPPANLPIQMSPLLEGFPPQNPPPLRKVFLCPPRPPRTPKDLPLPRRSGGNSACV